MKEFFGKSRQIIFALAGIVCMAVPLTVVADNSAELPTQALANNPIRVSGIIRDEAGEPLIGVTVSVKGTTQGTITDVDGNYIITAPAGSTLIFSFIGFKTQEMPLTQDKNEINIVMSEDLKSLDDVVVVGYGVQRKISTIGAQSGINNISELKQPTANLTSVLAGRISGVVAMQRNGEAGKDDNTEIWIRGMSTTTNSSPLVLVDGVERSFGNLDPSDVESFQVLKDASATAVYGVKGANGVILITTKQGKKGKPKINFEYNYGVTNFTKVPDLADGATYMRMANEASTTRGGQAVYSPEYIEKTLNGANPYYYPNTNWQDIVFSDFGHNQKVNMNVNGGSEFAQYYVSVGYYNEGGLYKKNKSEQYDGAMNFDRFNFVSNLTMQVTKTTEAKLGISGYVSTYNTPRYGASDIFSNMLNAYPVLYPTLYANGELPYARNGGGVINPYGQLHRYGNAERNTSQTNTNFRITQKLDSFLQGLSATGMFSYDVYSRNDLIRSNDNPVSYYHDGIDENGDVILKRTDENMEGTDKLGFTKNNWGHRQYYLEGSINYSQTFAEKHRVSGMFLYNQTDYSNVLANNLNESIPYRSMGVAGRATYSFEDKYMGEVNFGYNGSENFSPKKRFGFFPSFGLGWVASSEKFFEPISPYISFLKFRASWGKAGNSQLNSNRRFAFQSIIGNGNGYTFGETNDKSYDGKYIQDIGVDVTWETSTKTNFGVDLNLFKDMITLQADIFKEKRTNIFLNRNAVPAYIGLSNTPLGNLGKVNNQGFEVTAGFNKKIDEVHIDARANITYNKNKIIEDDSPVKPYEWLDTRGLSLYYRMGYICDGFYTQEEIENPEVAKPGGVYQAGDLKYRDLNDDGIIDGNDKTSIGRPTVPRLMYGFGTTLSYKNFSLGAFFQGVAQCDIMLTASDFIPFRDASSKGNIFASVADAWTEDYQNPDASWPRLNYGGKINENYETSTFWLRSGAYLRLKTLDFGYTIPSGITKKYGIDNLRVYFLGYNLLTFSDFDMWDVELGSGSGSRYPNIRTYSLGVNFSF